MGELLWNTFLGGSLHKNNIYEKNGSTPSPDFELCQPDISAPENLFVESKMVSCAHELKLPSHQIQRYEWLQLDPINNRNVKVKFVISRHNIRGLESKVKGMNQEERVELFANAICYSLVLPFSIIHNWYHSPEGDFINKKWNPSDEAIMTYKRAFLPMQRISSRALNEMFANPEETLKKMGISLEDYILSKQTFQGDVKVKTHNYHRIKSFPILFVEEKNSTKLLEQFRQEHTQEHEEYLKALEQERLDAERQLAEFSLKHEEKEGAPF